MRKKKIQSNKWTNLEQVEKITVSFVYPPNGERRRRRRRRLGGQRERWRRKDMRYREEGKGTIYW